MSNSAASEDLDLRVLVHAPFGRDASISVTTLAAAGLSPFVCTTLAEMQQEIARGAAVLIVTQESLTTAHAKLLQDSVQSQPPWSDLPILIFLSSGQGDETKAVRVSTMLGNVTVLERPVSRFTMVSAAQAALRARRRQYEVRDLLLRREAEIRQRDQFLAMLGHELRNPLTAITNAMELIKLRLPPEDSLRRPFQVIGRQGAHLAHLVDDLLDVSRVTSGKVTLDCSVLDLREALRGALGPLEPQFRASRVDLEVNLGAQPLHVNADPTRLEQVFTNLLTNALKYTPPDGSVSVTAKTTGSEVAVHVADTGIGLSPEMATQVFELFVQSERALDRSQGGLGIGLTIVRSLLELHGGNVTATSPGVGKGSTFTVKLPLAQEAPLPSISPIEKPVEQGQRHVLIVEDNEDNREGLKELLEALGFRVDVASDGEQGLQLGLRLRPDVALVDIGLPTLNGYEVAEGLRRRLGSNIRLVALTGYGQPDDVQRSSAAGFDSHLTKPPNLELLLAAIRDPDVEREAG